MIISDTWEYAIQSGDSHLDCTEQTAPADEVCVYVSLHRNQVVQQQNTARPTDMYTCEGYIPEQNDSTDADTLYYYEKEIVFDEDGNPVERQVRRKRELPEDDGMESGEKQNGLREEEINFNNL